MYRALNQFIRLRTTAMRQWGFQFQPWRICQLGVPISRMWAVATCARRQKPAGRRRYPLVFMLEPLLRCTLAYPAHILRMNLKTPPMLP